MVPQISPFSSCISRALSFQRFHQDLNTAVGLAQIRDELSQLRSKARTPRQSEVTAGYHVAIRQPSCLCVFHTCFVQVAGSVVPAPVGLLEADSLQTKDKQVAAADLPGDPGGFHFRPARSGARRMYGGPIL